MNHLPIFFAFLLILSGSSLSFSQDATEIPQPTNISFDLEALKKLDFGTDSLNGDHLLFTLFPAPMREDDPELSDWRTAAYWRCSSCDLHEFVSDEYDSETEKETLPYDANYTIFTNVLYYQSERATMRAVASFSTSQMNDGTGRFTRGALSLATFEKQNGKWKLLHFNPFVNLQGTFTVASPVDEVLIGENGKTYFFIHGGEANGVSADDYWPLYQGLYILDGETLRELFHVKGASCEENGPPVGSVWHTSIEKISAVPDGVQFKLKTSGLIVKEHNWYKPNMLRFVSEQTFEALPPRFDFVGFQFLTKQEKGLKVEKPHISIRYEDERGVDHKRVLETQNTPVE